MNINKQLDILNYSRENIVLAQPQGLQSRMVEFDEKSADTSMGRISGVPAERPPLRKLHSYERQGESAEKYGERVQKCNSVQTNNRAYWGRGSSSYDNRGRGRGARHQTYNETRPDQTNNYNQNQRNSNANNNHKPRQKFVSGCEMKSQAQLNCHLRERNPNQNNRLQVNRTNQPTQTKRNPTGAENIQKKSPQQRQPLPPQVAKALEICMDHFEKADPEFAGVLKVKMRKYLSVPQYSDVFSNPSPPLSLNQSMPLSHSPSMTQIHLHNSLVNQHMHLNPRMNQALQVYPVSMNQFNTPNSPMDQPAQFSYPSLNQFNLQNSSPINQPMQNPPTRIQPLPQTRFQQMNIQIPNATIAPNSMQPLPQTPFQMQNHSPIPQIPQQACPSMPQQTMSNISEQTQMMPMQQQFSISPRVPVYLPTAQVTNDGDEIIMNVTIETPLGNQDLVIRKKDDVYHKIRSFCQQFQMLKLFEGVLHNVQQNMQ